jgi:5-methylcytosine-specific restriction endonuclease McrA
MPPLTPDFYLAELVAMTSSEAKRMWRKAIKELFSNKCIYCDSDRDLTLDHVKPRSKGGDNISRNVVCACRCCNQQKGSEDYLSWYRNQPFHDYLKEWQISAWTETA